MTPERRCDTCVCKEKKAERSEERQRLALGTKLSLHQAARAHLEALLPAMAAEESGAEAPRRLELLSGIVLLCQLCTARVATCRDLSVVWCHLHGIKVWQLPFWRPCWSVPRQGLVEFSIRPNQVGGDQKKQDLSEYQPYRIYIKQGLQRINAKGAKGCAKPGSTARLRAQSLWVAQWGLGSAIVSGVSQELGGGEMRSGLRDMLHGCQHKWHGNTRGWIARERRGA